MAFRITLILGASMFLTLLALGHHEALRCRSVPAVAPVLDESGRPIPGSVSAFETFVHDGAVYRLDIRGRDLDAPVLLLLDGELRCDEPELVRRFLVVRLRSGGRQAGRPPAGGLAGILEAVGDHLRGRFSRETIHVPANGVVWLLLGGGGPGWVEDPLHVGVLQ